MKKQIILSVISFVFISGIVATFWLIKEDKGGFETRPYKSSDEEGEEKQPNDWFFRQRAYPIGDIPMDRRLASIASAKALSVTAGMPGVWTEAGPTNIPGRITDIAVHPSNLSTIYAGAAAGGVFKSSDGGSTWFPIFDDQGSPSIGALAIHPNDPNILYVGTGEANSSGDSYSGTGIYKTTDGGITWTYLGLSESYHIGRIVIDPVSPETVYVAVLGKLFNTNPDRGVYKSTDGGASWSNVLFVSDSTSAVDIAINPSNPNLLYVAMWERIRTPERRKAGGVTSGIYKTPDGGQSWTLLTNGLPPSSSTIGRIGLAVASSSPNIVYAIYADHPGYFMGVYKTTDDGLTWNQVNDGALALLYNSYGWYFGNIRVDPTNPNKIFAMGVPLYLSSNGGNSWTEVATTVHVDHHAMVIPSSNPSRIYLGNDGGVYLSTNGGTNWTQSLNMPSTQFYAINIDRTNPQRLYGGTQDNGTLRTLTGALNDWEEILGGDGFYCAIDYNNSNILYAEYQWGSLYKSTNNGFSWSDATNGINGSDRTNWSTPVVMDPNNPSILYYGSNRLYRTTNGANLWTAISPDLTDGPGSGNLTYGTITTIAPSPSDPQVVYVGTDDANVWVTQNLGTNWTDISTGLPNRWVTRVAVDPYDAAIAYVTHSGYKEDSYLSHIHRTSDYGLTWLDISSNLPESPINAVVLDPDLDSTLYVGTDVGIYVTYTLGQSWLPLGTGLNIPVIHDLVLHQGTRALVAGTHGRSMFRYDLGSIVHDGSVLSIDSPGDTVYSNSIVTPIATVRNFGNVTETFDVIALVDTYADTIQISSLQPDSTDQIIFSDWQVPSADSSLYTLTVCTEVSQDSDSTNDCAGKSIFAYRLVGVEEEESNEKFKMKNEKFQLLQNHPNPFHSTTLIRYEIPPTPFDKGGQEGDFTFNKGGQERDLQHVSLTIYDITGRIVETLVDGMQKPGIYQLPITSNQLPGSGVYFYRLTVGAIHELPLHTATKKLILLK